MKNTILVIALASTCFYGCFKKNTPASPSVCTNTDAVNYNQAGTCIYPKDNIIAVPDYKVKITKYNLDPGQIGESFDLQVRNSPCLNLSDSFYKIIDLHWVDGYFMPYDYCVTLSGYSFTIPPTIRNFTWAGAPVSGTGTFTASGGFQFTGIVHSSDGDSAMVVSSY